MAKRKHPKAHSDEAHKADINELLAQFPVTGTDRFWRAEPVAAILAEQAAADQRRKIRKPNARSV